MSTKKPITGQTSLLSMLPQLLFFAILIIVFDKFIEPYGSAVLLSCATYLAMFICLRNLVLIHHRRGMRHYMNSNYEKAILEYKKSYDFFTKHKLIDKFRCITVFSWSAISYTEMDLCNIAFNYSMLGDGEEARRYYERALKEFPNSELAKTSLKLMDSTKGPDVEK